MSNLDHIVLFTLLFAVFFFITKWNQKFLNKHFWAIASVPILAYSLVLGCRYGWGHDYLWYKRRFENPYWYADEDPGFRILNLFLQDIGFNYVGAFIFYSFVLIVGAYVLVRDYKENKYMLALFLPATLLFSTFPIRQAVAHAFVFLGFHFLNKRKWIWSVFMIVCMYSIHPSSIITFAVCSALFFVVKKPFPYQILIPIYIVVTVAADIFSAYFFNFFSNISSYLVLDNKFQNYLDKSEIWFGTEGMNEDWEQGTLALFLSMAFHTSMIYIGGIALKYRPNNLVVYFYNGMIVGLLLLRLFFTLEILKRIANPFVLLYFIPTGYAISFICDNTYKLTKKEKLLCRFSVTSILIYLVLYWGRFILQSPGYKFFWN